MSNLIFVYPHTYEESPEGSYLTIAEEEGLDWPNTYVIDTGQDPFRFLSDFRKLNLPRAPLVPLTEEAVLAAALVNSEENLPGLKISSALRAVCTDQKRKTIDKIDRNLNPNWKYVSEFSNSYDESQYVVKAVASTLSHGIRNYVDTSREEFQDVRLVARKAEKAAYYEIARVRRVLRSELNTTIIEDYIPGPQFEISGIVNREGKICYWFNALLQHWDKGRISLYESCTKSKTEELRNLVSPVVEEFKFKNCCFNVEVRRNKIIEIQPRLGEEPGELYSNLLSSSSNSFQIIYDNLISY